jgi:mRNA interferase MazF
VKSGGLILNPRWVEKSPSGESTKTRPALIVSNDLANSNLNRVQVIPLTSNTGRLYPSEALVSVAGKSSKAMADQITTAAKERLKSKLGTISHSEMQEVEKVIRIQLGMRF